MDLIKSNGSGAAAHAGPRMEGWKRKGILLIVSLVFAVVLAEGILRVFFHRMLAAEPDERSLLYRYHERLGWFPVPNSTNLFTGSTTITTAHNHNGFRDRDHIKSQKPRVLVLGDSFVWGYDVEAADRFTEKLQLRHPDWDIYNAGVSGYGTDQEFILLQQCFEEIQPAVVLLIFCSQTDHDDNSMNVRYGGYYKPYYVVGPGGQLELKGIPVPKFEKAFCAAHRGLCKSYLVRLVVRAYCRLKAPSALELDDPTAEILVAMRKYVIERGSLFAVGIESPYPPLKQLLEDCHVPCVDLVLGGTGPDRYRLFGGHWTPKGHAFVSDRLDGVLTNLVNAPETIRNRLSAEPDADKALAQFHRLLIPFTSQNLSTKQTIEAYCVVLQEMPDFPAALNNLAWILSTDPDPTCRDGSKAVRLAEQACKLTEHKRADMVGTLAAAYAEVGRYADAVTAGEEARRLAEANGNLELEEKNQKLVEIYKRGKPYHGSAP